MVVMMMVMMMMLIMLMIMVMMVCNTPENAANHQSNMRRRG